MKGGTVTYTVTATVAHLVLVLVGLAAATTQGGSLADVVNERALGTSSTSFSCSTELIACLEDETCADCVTLSAEAFGLDCTVPTTVTCDAFEEYYCCGLSPCSTGSIELLEAYYECTTLSSLECTFDFSNNCDSGAENTGSDAEITGSDAEITGSDAEITGSDAEITGSDAENTGSDAEITGSDAEITGSDAEITGSDAKNTDSDAENSGSDAENTGSDAENTGSDAEDADADAAGVSGAAGFAPSYGRAGGAAAASLVVAAFGFM